MSIMFWIWLSVMIIAVVIEISTTELISIWFAFGAVIPFIISAIGGVGYEWQIFIFIAVSAVLIVSLRKVTLKFLFRNSSSKTNVNAIVGQQFRLLKRTDFETVGAIKVNGVEWSVVGDNAQTIEQDEVVEVIKVQGNKLIVAKVKKTKKENKEKINKGN